jgi:hypothetical protein
LSVPFNIYDTRLFTVKFDKKTVHCESWVVDDYFFMIHHKPEAFGTMFTKEILKELGILNAVKYPKSDFVAVIKKSVFEIATDYDFEHLIRHESAHYFLGHRKGSTKQTEKEVDELVGLESAEASHLFGIRYMMLKLKDNENNQVVDKITDIIIKRKISEIALRKY